MKRVSTVAILLCALICTQSFAQERRLLTMEDAILNRSLLPANITTVWENGSVYQIVGRDSVNSFDARSGKRIRQIPRSEWMYPSESSEVEFFTRENNLYCNKNGVETAVTSETDPNIVSGQTVSRNEFGIDGGIFVSPDAQKVAFYRKDESRVTDFPLLDITTRTGSLKNIKYPMNGMPSERVSLGVWNLASEQTVWLEVTDFDEERYLTNVTWSPDSKRIYIQVLNRAQKEMHLNAYDAETGAFIETLFTDTDPRYVEPQHPLRFVNGDPDRFNLCDQCTRRVLEPLLL